MASSRPNPYLEHPPMIIDDNEDNHNSFEHNDNDSEDNDNDNNKKPN